VHCYITDTDSINAFFVREDVLPDGAIEALPMKSLRRGTLPIHAKPTRERRGILVDYLEWTRVYAQPLASQHSRPGENVTSSCALMQNAQ
jgi:hypothetical protein